MAEETIFLQHWLFTKFLLPFLLSFFIVFAILERTKLFGENKKSLNALTAFVIGAIFTGAVYPKLVVSNLILFLTVAIVAIFVILLIWGFIFGDKDKFELPGKLKWGLAIVACLAFIGAIIWATGFNETIGSWFSGSDNLVSVIITNAVFLLVIAVAVALILLNGKKK